MSSRKDVGIPQRRARQITRKIVRKPSKGLNNLDSPSLINDKEFSQIQNMEYAEGGVIRKRSGTTQVLDSLTAAKGLATFTTEAYRHICTVDDGDFKYTTTGSWTADTTVSFYTGGEIDYTQARDELFIWDGNSGGAVWTGTALSRPGTIPKAKFSIYYDNVQIASGVTGQPNRLYISANDDASMFTRSTDELDDATEVPGATVFTDATSPYAQFIDVRKNDGDKITGLSRYQDVVLVFKERSIYQLAFDESGQPSIALITGSTGCVGHKSIEAVENDVYFLSREGIRVIGNEPNFFTSIRTNLLSIRIQDTIDSINAEYYTKCNAHYFDDKYILSVPTADENIDTAIVYDRRFQAWTIWKDFNSSGFIRYVDSSNSEYLYFVDADGTKVNKLTPGTYNDNGNPIEAFCVSKNFDGNTPDITKFFTDIGLIFRKVNGQLEITIYEDSGTSVGSVVLAQGAVDGMGLLPLGMQTLGLGTGETSEDITFTDEPYRVVTNLTTKAIKYKLYNNRLNENFVLLGHVWAYYPYTHFLYDSSRKLYI